MFVNKLGGNIYLNYIVTLIRIDYSTNFMDLC